jgi:hypothetical protein
MPSNYDLYLINFPAGPPPGLPRLGEGKYNLPIIFIPLNFLLFIFLLLSLPFLYQLYQPYQLCQLLSSSLTCQHVNLLTRQLVNLPQFNKKGAPIERNA